MTWGVDFIVTDSSRSRTRKLPRKMRKRGQDSNRYIRRNRKTLVSSYSYVYTLESAWSANPKTSSLFFQIFGIQIQSRSPNGFCRFEIITLPSVVVKRRHLFGPTPSMGL